METFKTEIINTENLTGLCDLLNRIPEDTWENPVRINMCDLPTFGGEDPGDTDEIWSWDKQNLLLCNQENGRGYKIYPRGTL